MMHKIKKAAAHVTTKTTPESAEYAEYVIKLTNLSTYLKASSAALQESERSWKDVAQKQKAFADAFSNKYPDKDVVRDFAKTSASKSQALVKEFVLKTEGSSAPHHDLDNIVQEYLAEIAAAQEQYKEVTALNTEMQMYNKKVEDLTKGKKPDETKTARNMEKLDEAKAAYENKLDTIVEEMKAIYGKRSIVLRATYIAYWSSQLRAFDLLKDALTETRDFVETGVEPLQKIQIATVTEEEAAAFAASSESAMGSKSQPSSPINDASAEADAPVAA
eukprot:Plantae.Rhodophyta-Palmaria_palmata.ctg2240.p1 GENE.Plantae.Rhodophyta-Palmaria_palmata.ctg2240~~Plantae.Rhodophyta-Palmaria_palmata.ctg2240.p1  ORF type:complete len:276 (-),score=75.11 Plantae.Rhodophyta-Palmaria_palmata.ctg2240:246-1073(-)